MQTDFQQRTNKNIDTTIEVPGDSEQQLIGVISGSSTVHLTIKSQGDNAHFTGAFLCLAKKGEPITCTINADLLHNHCKADIHILALYADGGDASIDGGISIHPNIIKAQGHLLEENIILGDNVTIKTLPQLDVRSNDVEASHGARIEKLDAKKLFYIQSRGLPIQEAVRISVAGHIESLLSPLAEKKDTEAMTNKYLNHILDM